MKEERQKNSSGVLTVEATIAYTIFMMLILTILFIMRIVYAYALIQHATCQTAKELSMYSYLYQISGANDLVQQMGEASQAGEERFNADAENLVKIYQSLSEGNFNVSNEVGNLTKNPKEILKEFGSVLAGNATRDIVNGVFSEISRSMMAGYIAADSDGANADSKLKDLQVIGGLSGLNFTSSSFFEDGSTIDIVVCYTLDPILPIDLMPEMNFMNRATICGMGGSSMFSANASKSVSVWDMKSDTARGKAIQEKEGVRNLPENFKTFSAYNETSKEAIAEISIDLREDSYQSEGPIASVLRRKCNKIENFTSYSSNGYTLKKEDIHSQKLIVYIPKKTTDRDIDRSIFDKEVQKIREEFPDIKIEVKELE